MIDKIANIEFYKNLYENEINRKNEINGLVSFPTTLLTLMIGGGFYLYKPIFQNGIEKNSQCISIIIAILAILFAISIAVSIFFLIKMFHNLFRKYHYLPSPENLKNRQIELFEHYNNFFTTTKRKKIKKKSIKLSKIEFRKDLLNYYIEDSTKNQIVNDRRCKDYYLSRHYLMISLILLAISGILIIFK